MGKKKIAMTMLLIVTIVAGCATSSKPIDQYPKSLHKYTTISSGNPYYEPGPTYVISRYEPKYDINTGEAVIVNPDEYFALKEGEKPQFKDLRNIENLSRGATALEKEGYILLGEVVFCATPSEAYKKGINILARESKASVVIYFNGGHENVCNDTRTQQLAAFFYIKKR